MNENINMNQQQLSGEFTNSVKEYLILEEEISRLNVALKERRTKLKALSSIIMRGMSENDVQYVNLKNGVLVYSNKESKKGLNKNNLLSGLNIVFNENEEMATKAANTILENRETVQKTSLKLKKF